MNGDSPKEVKKTEFDFKAWARSELLNTRL
jgi:hypothetical protein